MRLVAPAALAAFAALLLASCAAQSGAPIVPTGSPAMPSPSTPQASGGAVGGYLLTTDPAIAPFHLTFRFVDRAGASTAFDEVPAGATTEVLRTSFAGPHRIMLNGVICAGTFEVRDRLRTLIVVSVPAVGECAIEVVGEEPYE